MNGTKTVEWNTQQVAAILNNSPDAILLVTPELYICQANTAFYRLFACTQHDCLNRSLLDFIHREDAALVRLTAQVVLNRKAAHENIQETELRACRKDGSSIDIKLSIGYLQADQLMLTLHDITERKQAEKILREQRDFLQLVIDSVPDLITVNDRAGYFHMVNKPAAQIYGLTPAEMVGKTDAEVNPNPSEVDYFVQTDQAALDSGQVVFIPQQTILGRYYQTSKIPLKNPEGRPNRLLVVSFDITVHKQAEAALHQALQKEKELNELKSRFVSIASHEFRTPLTGIMMVTETLLAYRQRLSPEQIDQRLRKIRERVEYLTSIMEDVLQLARLEARRAEFNPVPLDLDELVRSILDEFQHHPEMKHQILYQHDSLPVVVELDKKLMRQIISNLVSNAIKYSGAQKPILFSLQQVGANILLQIQDQGIGIPPADLQRLFEPFHRGTNVGTVAGTGLGLTIIREAVELHGGTIAVESEVGVGTTVRVQLPIVNGKEIVNDENFGN